MGSGIACKTNMKKLHLCIDFGNLLRESAGSLCVRLLRGLNEALASASNSEETFFGDVYNALRSIASVSSAFQHRSTARVFAFNKTIITNLALVKAVKTNNHQTESFKRKHAQSFTYQHSVFECQLQNRCAGKNLIEQPRRSQLHATKTIVSSEQYFKNGLSYSNHLALGLGMSQLFAHLNHVRRILLLSVRYTTLAPDME